MPRTLGTRYAAFLNLTEFFFLQYRDQCIILSYFPLSNVCIIKCSVFPFLQDFSSTILEVLTPDDVRVLAASEDELSRLGDFERIFPSPTSSRYLRFFEQPRYLNILLNQWEQKYSQIRSKGMCVCMHLWLLLSDGVCYCQLTIMLLLYA